MGYIAVRTIVSTNTKSNNENLVAWKKSIGDLLVLVMIYPIKQYLNIKKTIVK